MRTAWRVRLKTGNVAFYLVCFIYQIPDLIAFLFIGLLFHGFLTHCLANDLFLFANTFLRIPDGHFLFLSRFKYFPFLQLLFYIRATAILNHRKKTYADENILPLWDTLLVENIKLFGVGVKRRRQMLQKGKKNEKSEEGGGG